MSKFPTIFVLSTLLTFSATACKGDSADKQEAAVVELPEASNGSPVAAQFVEFVGEGEGRGVKVKLYNHGDKKAGGYGMLLRYYKDDELLKVKPGTAFEDDSDFTSLSGNSYACEPKKNADIELDGDMLAVPAEATRAEVRVSKVDVINGGKLEKWWSQDSWRDWSE